MANENSNQPPDSRPTDPRLKSFLRKATAIIAAEKGLNSESRRKLETLADHLKLPPSLLAEGLARLQRGIEPASSLTHYERAFIKLLDTDFEKITGGIISPSVEAQAISMAKRKYEINSTRAEQLIAARAEAAGLSLISSQESESFAEHAIVDRVGKSTEVNDEQYDEILKIGRKWGLGQYQIERIVGQLVAQNISDQKPRWNKTLISVAALLIVGAVAALGAAYSAGWIPDRWIGLEKEPAEQPTSLADSLANTTPDSRFRPELYARVQKIGSQYPPLQPALANILSDVPSQRIDGYDQLVRAAASEENADRSSAAILACELYYSDPDLDAALSISATIGRLVPFPPTAQSTSVRDLENSFHANDLVGRLKFHSPNATPHAIVKKNSIDDLIRNVIDLSPDSWNSLAEYQVDSERAIANRQWNRLMQTAWSAPANAAVLFDAVEKLTRDRLDDIDVDQNRDDTLLAILSTDTAHWRVLEKNIQQSIESCDASKLIRWVTIFESCVDLRARDLIANSLLPRIDVPPATRSREDVANEIAKYGFRVRNRALQPVTDRVKSLDRFFHATMEFDSVKAGGTLLPDRIAQIALAVNTELAFCAALENQTHIDDSSFAEFDRLLAIPAPRLRQLIALPIDRRASNSAVASAATASDRRRMNDALNRLEQLGLDSSRLRILAVKQLKQIAHRFQRISYQEATTLAAYLLAGLDVEELLNVQQLVESFSHWPNLALAIADQLPESEVPMDQVMAISQRLLRRELEISGKFNWKQELRFLILRAVNNDLRNQVDLDSDNVKSNWNRLEIFLAEIYRERLALGTDQPYINTANSHAYQATVTLVATLAEKSSKVKHRGLMDRSIQLIRSSNASEIEKTGFANQLLIQQLAEDVSALDSIAIATQIVTDLESNSQRPPLAGDQLLATEMTLFKLINQKRKLLVQKLLAQEGLQ